MAAYRARTSSACAPKRRAASPAWIHDTSRTGARPSRASSVRPQAIPQGAGEAAAILDVFEHVDAQEQVVGRRCQRGEIAQDEPQARVRLRAAASDPFGRYLVTGAIRRGRQALLQFGQHAACAAAHFAHARRLHPITCQQGQDALRFPRGILRVVAGVAGDVVPAGVQVHGLTAHACNPCFSGERVHNQARLRCLAGGSVWHLRLMRNPETAYPCTGALALGWTLTRWTLRLPVSVFLATHAAYFFPARRDWGGLLSFCETAGTGVPAVCWHFRPAVTVSAFDQRRGPVSKGCGGPRASLRSVRHRRKC